MLNFMIVVDDAGELKTVSALEIDTYSKEQVDEKGNPSLMPDELQNALNTILDRRAIETGEYDPSDNDTPIVVIASGA